MIELEKKQLQEICDLLEGYSNEREIRNLLSDYKGYELTSKILGVAFEKLFVRNNFSEKIPMETLVALHPSFRMKNGSTWCREDQSYLGKKYYINRLRKNGSGPIEAVEIAGENNHHKIKNGISKKISDEVRRKRCVILDVGTNIECDHKAGMKDDWRMNSQGDQKLDDFQPLCKAANIAKREHCNECLRTHKRYDATRLGYNKAFVYGDENTKTCQGCYWYDPKEFNRIISSEKKK